MGETFEKEVVVQRLGSLTVANLLVNGIRRVCNREVTERNIGSGDIEVTVEIALYLLEALYTGQNRRVQFRQDFACQQILFVCQHLGTGVSVIAKERVNKSTLTGRRFKKTLYLYALKFQRVRDCIHNPVVGIERGQC